jgi:putative ATPase
MKGLGYGKGYKYAHNEAGKVADMDCLPEALAGRKYIDLQEIGDEAGVKKRLEEKNERNQ